MRVFQLENVVSLPLLSLDPKNTFGWKLIVSEVAVKMHFAVMWKDQVFFFRWETFLKSEIDSYRLLATDNGDIECSFLRRILKRKRCIPNVFVSGEFRWKSIRIFNYLSTRSHLDSFVLHCVIRINYRIRHYYCYSYIVQIIELGENFELNKSRCLLWSWTSRDIYCEVEQVEISTVKLNKSRYLLYLTLFANLWHFS